MANYEDELDSDMEDLLKAAAQSLEKRKAKGMLRTKGGKGSGHHGHSGRPGMVGGSSAGRGTAYAIENNPKFKKNENFNPPDDYIMAVHTTRPKNVDSILKNGLVPGHSVKSSSWKTVPDAENVYFWRDSIDHPTFVDWQSKTESVVIFAVPNTVWKDPNGGLASMYKGTIPPEWIYGTIK